jgi:hypothetical protein
MSFFAQRLRSSGVNRVIGASRPAVGSWPLWPFRVSLDLTGATPPVSEVRVFLADSAPDKRHRMIGRFLDSMVYVSHFTNVWYSTRLGGAAEGDNRGLRPSFEAWPRARLTAEENR